MDRAPLGRYRRGETGTYRTMSCGVWRVIPHPEWTGFFGGHPPHLAYDSLIGSYAGAETRELSIILPSHSEPGLAVSCAPQKLARPPSQLDVTLFHSELPQAAASFLVWKVADCRGVQSG